MLKHRASDKLQLPVPTQNRTSQCSFNRSGAMEKTRTKNKTTKTELSSFVSGKFLPLKTPKHNIRQDYLLIAYL